MKQNKKLVNTIKVLTLAGVLAAGTIFSMVAFADDTAGTLSSVKASGVAIKDLSSPAPVEEESNKPAHPNGGSEGGEGKGENADKDEPKAPAQSKKFEIVSETGTVIVGLDLEGAQAAEQAPGQNKSTDKIKYLDGAQAAEQKPEVQIGSTTVGSSPVLYIDGADASAQPSIAGERPVETAFYSEESPADPMPEFVPEPAAPAPETPFYSAQAPAGDFSAYPGPAEEAKGDSDSKEGKGKEGAEAAEPAAPAVEIPFYSAQAPGGLYGAVLGAAGVR